MSNSVPHIHVSHDISPQHVVFSACKHNPQRRLSDRGRIYTSAVLEDMCQKRDVSLGNSCGSRTLWTSSWEWMNARQTWGPLVVMFLTFCTLAAPRKNGVTGEVALSLCFPACGGMTELNSGRCSWRDEPSVLICALCFNYPAESWRRGEWTAGGIMSVCASPPLAPRPHPTDSLSATFKITSILAQRYQYARRLWRTLFKEN